MYEIIAHIPQYNNDDNDYAHMCFSVRAFGMEGGKQHIKIILWAYDVLWVSVLVEQSRFLTIYFAHLIDTSYG
jgi:hypothetical protein